MKPISYHNDTQFKADFVAQTRMHREQDRYIKGRYGSGDADFKGCSLGCSVRSLKLLGRNSMDYGDHDKCAAALGWPEWLTHFQDWMFESLPMAEAIVWTEQLAAAVPVGVDLEPVKWKFCAFLMRENIERVLALTMDNGVKEQVVAAVRQVLAVHESAIRTGSVDEAAESAARSAAESAARSAAESAARSAAESAARSAAWSAAESAARSAAESAAESATESAARSAAESAAWSAAWSAARSAARSAAESAAIIRYKDELLRLLAAEGGAK